jgi:hypothetical protein
MKSKANTSSGARCKLRIFTNAITADYVTKRTQAKLSSVLGSSLSESLQRATRTVIVIGFQDYRAGDFNMFRPCKLTAAVAALLYGASPISAATVSGQDGTVLVNKGDGFIPITSDAELAPGGQIMVQPGGSALITYASNCTIRVGAGRVWTVQEAPPCAEGNTFIDFTGRMNQQGGSLKDGPAPILGPGIGTGEFVLFAPAIITGAFGLAVAFSHHDNGDPGLGVALSNRDKSDP